MKSLIERIIIGLQLFHSKGSEDLVTAVDIMYAGGPECAPDTLNHIEAAILEELGWHWDETLETWYHLI